LDFDQVKESSPLQIKSLTQYHSIQKHKTETCSRRTYESESGAASGPFTSIKCSAKQIHVSPIGEPPSLGLIQARSD